MLPRHTQFLAVLAAVLLCCKASAATSAAALPQTVIDSDALDMTAGEEANSFRFTGNVRAEGQGMLLTCDKLDIIARRQAKGKATIGKMNSVQSVVAQGNVRMEQAGRTAYAGRAEVLPDDGLVILSDNPRIVDAKATVEGWKIIYNSRDRTAQVLPTPDDQLLPGQKKIRSRVIIAEQAIPKLDYQQVLGTEKPEEKAAEPPVPTAAPTPAPAPAPAQEKPAQPTQPAKAK